MNPNEIISSQAVLLNYEKIRLPVSLISQVQAIVPSCFQGEDFGRRVLGLLGWEGKLSGVAYQPHPGGGPLLVSLVRYEARLCAWCNPDLEAFLAAVEKLADRLIEILLEQAKILPVLSIEPELRNNPLAYVQLKLANVESGHLVSPFFHRSLRGKLSQIEKAGLTKTTDIPLLLSKFISYPLMIAKNISSEDIRPHWSDYQDGEFESIIQETISRLAAKRNLSPRTINTLYRDWNAGFWGNGLAEEYQMRGHISRKTLTIATLQTESIRERVLCDFEDLSPDDSRQEAISNKCACDRKTLGSSDRHHTRQDRNNPTLNQHYNLGIPVIRNNPSAFAPSVLPVVTAGLIRLKQIQDLAKPHSLNARTARAVVDLLWHAGQSPEWIASLQVSWANSIPEYVAAPTYMPNLCRIIFMPELHIGWTERYEELARTNPAQHGTWRAWQVHDEIYESASLLHEIFILPPLLDELALVLELRSKKETQLFMWKDADSLRPLSLGDISSIFGDLTPFVRQYIPHHAALRASQFSSTFEGWYTSAGLSPEHRFLVSDKTRTHYALSLWYQTTDLAQLHRDYYQAYTRIEQQIRAEAKAVATSLGFECDDLVPSRYAAVDEVNRLLEPETRSVGSWRCARISSVRQTIATLLDAFNTPEILDKELAIPYARHNALTRLVIGLLLLFFGMRPFEIARIKTRHLDLPLRQLTVDAKPHCDELAARRLPLPSFLLRLFVCLLEDYRNARGHGKGKNLLFLYQPDGSIKIVDTATIEQVLAEAGQLAGLTRTPEAYSWRHLFCRMILSLELPYPVRRYLMGHEADGMETFNAYACRNLSQIDRGYQQVAAAIVDRFGLQAFVEKV